MKSLNAEPKEELSVGFGIRRITPERWSVEQENKRYKETPIKGKLEKER